MQSRKSVYEQIKPGGNNLPSIEQIIDVFQEAFFLDLSVRKEEGPVLVSFGRLA